MVLILKVSTVSSADLGKHRLQDFEYSTHTRTYCSLLYPNPEVVVQRCINLNPVGWEGTLFKTAAHSCLVLASCGWSAYPASEDGTRHPGLPVSSPSLEACSRRTGSFDCFNTSTDQAIFFSPGRVHAAHRSSDVTFVNGLECSAVENNDYNYKHAELCIEEKT